MASSPTQPLASIASAASSAVAAFGRSSSAITATMTTRIPTATGARWRAGNRQGLADHLRLRRQHDFGDADGLQRVVALPRVQSGQLPQVLRVDERLLLVF